MKRLALAVLLLSSTSWAAIERPKDPAMDAVVEDALKPEDHAQAPAENLEDVIESELNASEDTPPAEAPFNNQTTSAPVPLQTEESEAPIVESTPHETPVEETAQAQDASATEEDPTKPRYIHHPQAKKGLMKITKDGKYLYKVKPSKQNQAGGFTVGSLSPYDVSNPDTGATFRDIYGTKNPFAILVNYEYQFLKMAGKWGLKAGTGLTYSEGHGKLQTGQPALEKFTFMVLPNNIGIIYRMHLWDKQSVIPYAEAGGDYFTFMESRNDKKPTRYGGAFATHFSAGAALSLNWLDRMTVSRLDQEYGINSVYLTAEYRHVLGFGNYDMSTDVMSGGFLFEF